MLQSEVSSKASLKYKVSKMLEETGREVQAPLRPGFRKCRVAPAMDITIKGELFGTDASSLMVLVSNPVLLWSRRP